MFRGQRNTAVSIIIQAYRLTSVISSDFIRTFDCWMALLFLVILCRIKTLLLILMDSFTLLDFRQSMMIVKKSRGFQASRV